MGNTYRRPLEVVMALQAQDINALRAMGRKGAQAAARARLLNRAIEDARRAEILEECRLRDAQAHLDICPIDD